MCWIHQTALICAINYATEYLQQKISSPNMVCTDNHAKEDIQQYCCWHCHMKMERAREREERLRRLSEHFRVNRVNISDDQLQIAQAHPFMFKHLSNTYLYLTEAILQRHLQSDISDIRQHWVITTC